MRDRLIEIINKWDSTAPLVDHLIENGVIVPPCKVGDTVYVLFPDPRYNFGNNEIKIVECDVYGFHYCTGHNIIELRSNEHQIRWGIDDVGVSIFLTKEEAEKALRGEGE